MFAQCLIEVDDEDGVIYKKNHPLREGEHDIKELKTSMLLYCDWPHKCGLCIATVARNMIRLT